MDFFLFVKEVVIELLAQGVIRFFRGDPIFFRGWRRRKDAIEPAMLYLHHRKHAGEEKFWQAFQSNGDVMLITIKSLHTRNRLKEMVESGAVHLRSLRVLTLNPESPKPVFEALARHINEPLENCRTDCREAYQIFSDLASKHNYIEVRRYDCLPTIQGLIVNDRYAFLELLSYHSNPEDRIGLMVLKSNGSHSLKQLAQRFEKLWHDSQP